MNLTPEQLREMSAWLDADERTRGLPPETFHGFDDAAMLRAHAAALEELAKLRARLEIDPRHSYDGIAARDETIRLQDEEIERLDKAWKAQQFHLEHEEKESELQAQRAERAEAAALERLAEVEARPEFVKAGDGTLHGAIDYWQRKASTLDERLAERDAEIARLKGHAEAMAEELENIEYGEGCKTRADKAYRADYPETKP